MTHLSVEELELSNVKAKVMAKQSWSQEFADKVETDYRLFLARARFNRATPTRHVDEMWHTHILDTQKYAADCDALFGRFIHHVPEYDESHNSTGNGKCNAKCNSRCNARCNNTCNSV